MLVLTILQTTQVSNNKCKNLNNLAALLNKCFFLLKFLQHGYKPVQIRLIK